MAPDDLGTLRELQEAVLSWQTLVSVVREMGQGDS